jgi:ABC-type Zn uptake system ZnuABC Zn-binding protein ZnuA/ABC-type Mn2+/Zn2+ transport system permease subunit
MLDVFDPPYMQRALLEVALLSVAAGLLGTWIVLRGLAFFAHAAGTAAFPGLVLADGLGFAPPLGAFATALLFAGGVASLAGGAPAETPGARRGGYDSVTALVLVGCLALGVILASDVFHSGSGVEGLLFGSVLLIDGGDLALAAAASVLALAATWSLGSRWLARGFDPAAARSLGAGAGWLDVVLLALIGLAIVAALSTVGALLATALFVVPAASVRLVVDRLLPWQVATVVLVFVEGVAGLWLSVETNAPPGATIAVIAGGVFALAALVRGLRGRRAPVAALAGAALMGAMLLAGCGSTSDSTSTSGSKGKIDVVATTTQLGDFVRAVGGDRVSVHQILQPNTDPHDYEPRPSDVQATVDAKVVFENGDGLDHWMKKVVSESGAKTTAVDVGASVPVKVAGESSGPEASRYDPHWWHDPVNARAAVQRIRDVLSRAYPAAAAEFDRNARSYDATLAGLDSGIRTCFAAVPQAQRKLVTDHDAFNYFAKRYGIQVIGAVIPSQTTQAQASAGDVARLTDQVRREHVKAIFPESSLSPKVARAIARDTGATSSLVLYGDTLGPRGSAGESYVTMERANADAMVRGFTGGARSCTIAGIG